MGKKKKTELADLYGRLGDVEEKLEVLKKERVDLIHAIEDARKQILKEAKHAKRNTTAQDE